MATPNLLKQGILLSDSHYFSPNTHINSANLFNATMRNGFEMEDIGLVKTWSQMFKHVQPLYNFHEIAKKERQIDANGGFTWHTAVAMENPKIVEDLSYSDKPGVDEQEFQLAFDKPFSVTSTITYDHITNDIQLLVTQEPFQDGDRWIHTLKVFGTNVKNKYISKEYLVPGTEWYAISTYRGDEFDTVAASTQSEIGERKWHYYLGNSEAARDFHITKRAFLQLKHGGDQSKDFRTWELYKFATGSEGFNAMLKDPSINLTKLYNEVYKKDKKAMSKDIVSKNWFWEIERVTLDKLMQDYIMNLMWGVGGQTIVETDTFSVAPGLYWQHKNLGNVVYYNLKQMNLDFLRKRIEAHLVHRIDFSQETTLVLKVGAAIYNILEEEIRKEFNQVGAVLNVGDSDKFLSGDKFGLDFTMRFKSFYLKRFPKIKVSLQHEPALDPIYANDISNPIIEGGLRLSSYTIILYDLNDLEQDNIQLVTWKGDNKVRYVKKIGNIDWEDQNATFVGDRNFSGFAGVMSIRHGGMWLQDASKSLMFELINPYK